MVNLSHRDLGGAGRPPLVILHGFLGSSRNWQTTGAGLASRFHVCALDLRNHGRSPHAPEMTYAAIGEDVLAWMDAQNLPRAALLGHSMGGKVAMRLACRQPQRVARLIVVDIAPKDYTGQTQRAELAAMNELPLAGLRSRTEAEHRFAARVDDWAMRKFLATNLERESEGRWRWIVNLPVLTAALPELVKNPLAPDDHFAGPAQFILGGKSRFVSPGDHAAIRRHFPAVRLDVLPTSGHNPHIELREEFVRLVAGSDQRPR
ncbi:MAG: alpha/beta fold hydrolase [Opitutaceae bacterium]|nr:alpha/beta fold hydrolase [Opitutaceae bacterium]